MRELQSGPVPDAAAGAESAPTLLIVAGEASGDEHAARLLEALLKMRGQTKVFGMGGSALRAAGMELVVDSEQSASVMGLTEVVGSLRTIYGAYRTLLAAVDARKPDIAVLVDFPDFNLLLARALGKRKIPVVYFISPQLWAWRQGRVKTIKRYVRKVLPIFPFEESFYQQRNVQAEYIGHPFLDRKELRVDRAKVLTELGLRPDLPTVALLPGSRRSEVERLLEPMLGAVEQIRRARPGLQVVLPVAATLQMDWFEAVVGDRPWVRLVKGRAPELLRAADAAVVASGTATVEAALAQIPFVVVYRLSGLTYAIARRLITGVRHVAMANLVAGKKLVEELLQDDVCPARIAQELERFLGDPQRSEALRSDLALVKKRLSLGLEPGRTAAERAALAILNVYDAGKGRRR
ncbi:MAG: lipid-A-disaccharide synthase [Bdellovibrionales bacterium]|nr:lipid-A-disaccharide synthase [Bdellovibrionales bacterium]